MRKACSIALLLLLAAGADAQDPHLIPADLARLGAATDDSVRCQVLNRIAFNYADKDPAKGVEYGLRSLELAHKLRDRRGVGVIRNTIGYCYARLSRFQQADSLYALALSDLQKVGDRCAEAMCWYNMGLNQQMQSQLPGTLENFLRALEKGEGCPDSSQHSIRLYGLGSVYEAMERFDEALRYYQASFTIDSTRHDSARLAKEHIAIANTLGNVGRLDEVMDHYQASLRCSQAIGDTMMVGYVWYNSASVMKAQGRLAEAVEYAKQAVGVFVALKRPAELVHTENYLGWLYNLAERPTDAEHTLHHTLALATELGLRDERMNALEYLASAQRKQGNDKAALENYVAYMALKDSLTGQEQKKQLAEITAKYETEKKEKALLSAQASEASSREETQRQRTLKFIYLSFALILGLFALVFVGRYRTKRKVADALVLTNAEVLRQKERAEESERTKARFLANMSHEIRTPLNAIIGFTDLLLHERHDERTAHYLASVRDAGDNLLVLINDVLDLSRMEAGRLTLVNVPFDLHRCVRACAELLDHRAKEQRDSLTAELAPDLPQWVIGDGARLNQMLLNLVGNALKFTTDGSVDVLVDRHGANVRFRIRDTGIGIAEEKLTRVFDRFTQVHTSDHQLYGGTGLGLSIVKELATLHHGKVVVESRPGNGTTFTLELPYEATTAPVHASASPAHPIASIGTLNGRTILVAEDNPLNAQVTTATLKRHYPSVNVVVAINGRDAVERIIHDDKGMIALVLMDVQMPVLDGLAATREIRALHTSGARLPIIALTASVLPGDLSQCIDAGMDACVPKPFKAQELVDAIARLTADSGAPVQGTNAADDTDHEVLFRELVPERLALLRTAHAAGDHAETQRIVHFMRFQLVRYDPTRFSAISDRLLRSDAGESFNTDVEQLISAIEHELA